MFDVLLVIGFLVFFTILGAKTVQDKNWMPAQLAFDEVPEHGLTDAQRAFFSAADEELSAIGYLPITTFRITNMQGRTISRSYLRGGDPAAITISGVTSESPEAVVSKTFTEIVTRFQDGRVVNTRNANIKSPFARVHDYHIQDFPDLKDLKKLKEHHDRKAQKLGTTRPVFPEASKFFANMNAYHERFIVRQVETGRVTWDQHLNAYRMTFKTGLIAVKDFFNPVAQPVGIVNLLLGIAIGAGVPLLAFLSPAPHAIVMQLSGFSPYWSALLLGLGTYMIAGFGMGLTLRNSSLIWAVLLGFIPLKLAAVTAPLLYSCCAMVWAFQKGSNWYNRKTAVA
jgi:hypothetical protein